MSISGFSKNWLRIGVVVILTATAAVWFLFFYQSASAGEYTTEPVARATIERTISATGVVEAVTTVEVGTQVSGTVAWLGADFNSRVTRGQVLARLDQEVFRAQVASAQANVTSADAAAEVAAADVETQQASLSATGANLNAVRVQAEDAEALVRRYEELGTVISRRDLEAAIAQAHAARARVDQAAAQVKQATAAVNASKARVAQALAAAAAARAQFDNASANLSHTVIASPVDGVVVSRSVDVGQTVAASLQAPTLFTIAADLTNMQVLAAIDEADVGPVRAGLPARFTVDAYPDEVFQATLSQVRLGGQTQQNVVTYTAVISVANRDGKLLPGMTANITLPVARREAVLVVPNGALRFQPSGVEAPTAATTEAAETPGAGAEAQGRRGTVWVLGSEGAPEPRIVRTGLTDGRVTEILGGDMAEGERVITTETASASSSGSQSGSPFMMRPPSNRTRSR